MHGLHVTMKVRPAVASDIAAPVRTIVSKQNDRVLKYLILLIFYSQVVVRLGELRVTKLLESLQWIVCEYHCLRFCL